jgi:TonB family protein
MPDSLVSSPFLYNLSLTLIHFIWQGFFVALVLKVALSFTSYKNPQWRYAFSSLAMVANLLLPFITFFIIYQPDFQQFSPLLNNNIFLSDAIHNTAQTSEAWYSNMVEYLPYLSLSWLAVSFALALKLCCELYNVNQLPKTGTSPANDTLEARFQQLVLQVGLKSTPRILISLKNDVPMAIGWIKPVVLIPVSMLSGLTPTQLDMLILHELAHIRRHDYLVNFIQTLVELLLFFHPCVRWVSKQMRNEREYCSDDIAVHHCGNPIAYAHTLADTASICEKRRHHSIPAMAMAASGGDLKQRVVRLVDQNHHCATSNNSGKWLASIAIIFTMIGIASKKHFQLPIFDLSSGTISIYRNANDTFNSYNITGDAESLPALAQQLLHNDNAVNTNELEVILPVVPAPTLASSPKVESLELTPVSTSTINNSPIVIAQNQEIAAANANLDQLATVNEDTKTEMLSSTLPTVNPKKALDITSQVLTTYNKPSFSENLATKPILAESETNNKSMSELAFERTDSTLKSSVLNNPYTQQVAELANQTTDSFNEIKQGLPAIKDSTNTFKSVRLPAQVLSSGSPKYPSLAKRKGIELDIYVTFTIDRNGDVHDIQYDGKGRNKGKVSYFRASIRSALQKWHFTPASYNNQPIESTMSKIFSFSLAK